MEQFLIGKKIQNLIFTHDSEENLITGITLEDGTLLEPDETSLGGYDSISFIEVITRVEETIRKVQEG